MLSVEQNITVLLKMGAFIVKKLVYRSHMMVDWSPTCGTNEPF